MSGKAIGGYFELELPHGQGHYYPQALKYQSARATFYALLLFIKPKRVWMPYYICDSMLAPLIKAEIEVCFYSLNKDLSIQDDFELEKNDLLLYVNYFGVCSHVQDLILKKYNKEQIVFDHSQAFFVPPMDCLATIYSPRKFFGVPDGGLLVTSLNMTEPEKQDTGSFARTSHLLHRLAGEPEDGYMAYQANEKTLEDFQPRKMSVLTERLLNSINYDLVKQVRNTNFKKVHSQVGHSNDFEINQENINGPMGYPYLASNSELRSSLIKRRVFIPTYWPEVLERPGVTGTEKQLVENMNLIPCDQRYNENDIMFIIKKYNGGRF